MEQLMVNPNQELDWKSGFPSEKGTYLWQPKRDGVTLKIRLNQTKANIYDDLSSGKTRTFMAMDRDHPRHGRYARAD